jgi:hypothetical protein
MQVEYSNVQGGFSGTGNIDADPLFAEPLGGNFALSAESPCIDAGRNDALPAGVALDLARQARRVDDPATPDTGAGVPPLMDMGAYEFQAGGCPYDLDQSGQKEIEDLSLLLANFGRQGPGLAGDIDSDGDVDLEDLSVLLSVFGLAC